MKHIPASMITLFLIALTTVPAFAEQEVTLSIEGMTCELCALAVEKALESTDGVKEANASYEKKTAVVIAGDEVSEKNILGAIEKAGPYTAEVMNKEMR